MNLELPTDQDLAIARRVIKEIAQPGTQIRVAAMLFRQEAFDFVLDATVGSSYEYGYILPGAQPDNFKDAIVFHLDKPLDDGRRSYVSPDRRYLYIRDNFTGIYCPL
jgi:hypothetical protein